MTKIIRNFFLLFAALFSLPTASALARPAAVVTTQNPILFVTQVPLATYTNITFTFGNQRADMDAVGRGGDLWIRFPNGALKNLTATAGYGLDTNGDGILTGNEGIAVRDPAVDWTGTKAVFSMVVGAPTEQYEYLNYYWQLYEITGLGQSDTPVITKVPNQPATYNNVSPVYGSDGRIIFTSDRPRNGATLLYPQLDEYEEEATVSGVWSLDPSTGNLFLVNHAPSGDFTPIIDSYGRIVFTQWDHLQRDQQADADFAFRNPGQSTCGASNYGTFNYDSETVNTYNLNNRAEVFPEARSCRTDQLASQHLVGHTFNLFLPWTINQDGTDAEVLNHIGRHEFLTYIDRVFNNDPALDDYYTQYGNIANTNALETGMFHIQEDPLHPGTFYGVDTPEFGYHSTGRVIRMVAPLGVNADQLILDYITHPDTYGDTATANHSGRYREPLPLADGQLIAVHTATKVEENGSDFNSNYALRLKTLTLGGNGYFSPSQTLTTGISKNIKYWDPDNLVNYNGVLWELNPVEVRARTVPGAANFTLAAPEQNMFNQADVTLGELQDWMKQYDLALIVGHDMTTRDDMDMQQPFNLQVPGGAQTLSNTYSVGDIIYNITHLQFFQADQLRGLTFGSNQIQPGRRVLAQNLHDPNALAANPQINGPVGSVALATDGSFAAFVPARRAMTWQLTDANGTGIIRERYWLTFQPGEVRVCKSCHGLNEVDQAGNTAPENNPQALLNLLMMWKASDPIGGPPHVNAIARASANPTTNQSVQFNVTFSKAVSGVDLSDFSLAAVGLTGASLTSVSGSGNIYTVTANSGSGSGTLGLNLVDNDSILDATPNPLGGVGAGNGNFTGEVYNKSGGTITALAGTHDDKSTVWTYTGTWTSTSATSAYGGSFKSTTSAGGSATVYFSGVQAKLYYTKNSSMGKMDVYIDDVFVTQISENASTAAYKKTWLSPVYADGVHKLTLVRSTSKVNVDAVQVIAPPVPVGPGTYENNNANWVFSGTWTNTTVTGATGGTVRTSSIISNSASLTVSGASGFTLRYFTRNGYGSMDVYVDNVKVTTLIQSSGSLTVDWKTYTLALTPGTHTIKLVDASGKVNFDNIVIAP